MKTYAPFFSSAMLSCEHLEINGERNMTQHYPAERSHAGDLMYILGKTGYLKATLRERRHIMVLSLSNSGINEKGTPEVRFPPARLDVFLSVGAGLSRTACRGAACRNLVWELMRQPGASACSTKERTLEPGPPPWQGGILPLDYWRTPFCPVNVQKRLCKHRFRGGCARSRTSPSSSPVLSLEY